MPPELVARARRAGAARCCDAAAAGPAAALGLTPAAVRLDIVYLSQAARSRYTALGLPERADCCRRRSGSQAGRPPPRSVPAPHRLSRPGARPARRLAGARDLRGRRRLGLDAELLLLPAPRRRPSAACCACSRRVRRSPVRDRVAAPPRCSPPDELRERLATCHAFLLPFKVPVSEVPLVVIEAGLSGRPLVVLDAPGRRASTRTTSAASSASRPRRCRRCSCAPAPGTPIRPPTRGPGRAGTRRCEPVLAWKPSPFSRYRFVGLIGVDGSGKTFLLDRAQRRPAPRRRPAPPRLEPLPQLPVEAAPGRGPAHRPQPQGADRRRADRLPRVRAGAPAGFPVPRPPGPRPGARPPAPLPPALAAGAGRRRPLRARHAGRPRGRHRASTTS